MGDDDGLARGEIGVPNVLDDDYYGGFGDANLMIDLDMFRDILDEPPSSDQNQIKVATDGFSDDNLNFELVLCNGNYQSGQLQSEPQMIEGLGASGAEFSYPALQYPTYGPEASEAHYGVVCGSFDSLGNSRLTINGENPEHLMQRNSMQEMHYGSYGEWHRPDQQMESLGLAQTEIPSCSTLSSYAGGSSNYVSGHEDKCGVDTFSPQTKSQLVNGGQDIDSADNSPWESELDEQFVDTSAGTSLGTSIAEEGIHESRNSLNDADVSSQDVISTKSTICYSLDVTNDSSALSRTNGIVFTDAAHSYSTKKFNSLPRFFDEEIKNSGKDKRAELQTDSACSISNLLLIDGLDQSRLNSLHGGSNQSIQATYFCSNNNNIFQGKQSKNSVLGTSHSVLRQKNAINIKEERRDAVFETMRMQQDTTNVDSSGNCSYLDVKFPEPDLPEHAKDRKLYHSFKVERECKVGQSKGLSPNISRFSPESIQSTSSGSKSQVDDDSDVLILEDISQPSHPHHYVAYGKSNVPLQCPVYGDSFHKTGVTGIKHKSNDERFIFRMALQDLSQPKTESNPPDGHLAVPLLRHQRIALSWMVQKETSSLNCFGGILADDQGLGKTVSTIALILKERPHSLGMCAELVNAKKVETLYLDDDEVAPVGGPKKEFDTCDDPLDRSAVMGMNSKRQSKGRPAAGTLIVCPTSVLRQWADELQKKVTNEANLFVLVYHGGGRTKDPCELAKYDVVLTTYSIVSMEVPKQALVDEDDDQRRKHEGDDVAVGKKRKYPPTGGKKGPKNKKGVDDELIESVAGPLAKVGWFRVVLDEAQSIKNHRTQAARACWGLRAKRRWCLSGTPIQNAIDDLYSYFRFLRYDPYAVYQFFCSTIKHPIQRNPTKGYKKLQAVLKTIMLRRTKATLLDGEPIVSLPPKVVKLEKVDFTAEEREFYTKLEIASREQFREYAAAGTVKNNYVNILLMLLRLRQACDHPLLVRDSDSVSSRRSSDEIARKLPREKQIHLLNCLEASLAICGICNDPPEDAVVSVCGHVFCNQCISEHLIGDDNLCPTSSCKVRLRVTSVFSKGTLKSSLSDQPNQITVSSESANQNSQGGPCDSSKIRAAVEVMRSLTKPQNSCENPAVCPTNSTVKVVGDKAIVFSQWTRMLDLLEPHLKSSSIQYRRLDGTMSVVARDKAVKDFNSLPEVTVMIMSLKAASLGLNMVAANHVLLLDLWWNPTTEDQAIDRAHRIGQTRPVTVLRFTIKDSVEDRILALQQKKREMVSSAFGEDETGGRQTRLTVDDLNYLFMA